MRLRKSGKRAYGVDLTANERKAMETEIKRQLAEYDKKHGLEIDALILWVLSDEFGFGPKRLRRFYDRFADSIKALIKRYDMDDADGIWLCTRKLKDKGVDIEAWHNENNGGNK